MATEPETWHVLLVAGMALLSVGILLRGTIPWYVQYAALLGSVALSFAAVSRSQAETASTGG